MQHQSRLLRQVFANAAKQLLSADSTALGNKASGGAYSIRTGLQQRRTFTFSRDPQVAGDAAHQARQLRELNRRGDPEGVIRAFESGSVVSTEETLGEYVKALVRVDRLDSSALLQTLERGASGARASYGGAAAPGAAHASFRMAQPQQQYAEAAPLVQRLTGAAGAASAELGSAKQPLYVMQAEPTMMAQMWKTLRTLGVAFLVLSGLGALMEEKGLSRGILANPDMKPNTESTTKFADVKGVDEAKADLEEVVQYLRDPEKYTRLGGKLPKGVLLVGPPGTGKTMLARAIAGEAGVPFFYCSGSEFEEMFVGVGARRVRDLFAAAKKAAPCIVFIDEVDAVGGKRNPKDQQYMKQTLNQLLVELDGFKASEGVICVAATNFPESLDKALIRPGRFDWHVTVPNPDVKGRTEILASHFKDIPRAQDVDLSVIARGTPGFSGADLANLVNIAALKAARDNAVNVTHAALEFAKDRILMGAERKSAVISAEGRRLTAYHEGGHALVAMHTAGAHPVHKATIVPRGMALGMVMQLPEAADEHSVSRQQLLAKLDVAMGGRVAEELIFGAADVTTGASSDLEQATRLAQAMVTRYGMSESVGKVSINYDDMGQTLSSETRATVEREVKRLLAAAYERASNILTTHQNELHALAQELLDKESLTGKEIKELLANMKAGSGSKGGGGSGIVAKAKVPGKQPGTASAAA